MMLTRILLVAIFILSCWNSFQLSINDDAFRAQINELSEKYETTKKNIVRNQEILDGIKTLNTQMKLQLTKQSSDLDSAKTVLSEVQSVVNKHVASTKLTSGKLTNSSQVTMKKNTKVTSPNKKTLSNSSESFQQLISELEKTKGLYNKKSSKEMLLQLAKLKAEVWKSRKINGAPKDLVMSILSSIDITNKKWVNKDINYKLDNVERKIKQLVSAIGASK